MKELRDQLGQLMCYYEKENKREVYQGHQTDKIQARNERNEK